MRTVSMMSMPTSELMRRRTHRPLHGGWHRRAGCARAAEAQDPRCGVSEANDAKCGKGAASARPRAGDRTRRAGRRRSFDGHRLGEIARLIDVVATPIRNVIREELKRH